MTREAFENTIRACSAIGGSTNAPIHITAIARHVGVPLEMKDWQTVGHDVPLLVNMQPAGEYLGEEYYRAGGLPAVMAELIGAGLIRQDALTINGKTMGENCREAHSWDRDVIKPFEAPMMKEAGFLVLSGNLFDTAVMKTSVISGRVPRPLPLRSGPSQRHGMPRHRLRGAGGLSPPHRRSGAGDRRALRARHPRHGAARLSGRRPRW